MRTVTKENTITSGPVIHSDLLSGIMPTPGEKTWAEFGENEEEEREEKDVVSDKVLLSSQSCEENYILRTDPNENECRLHDLAVDGAAHAVAVDDVLSRHVVAPRSSIVNCNSVSWLSSVNVSQSDSLSINGYQSVDVPESMGPEKNSKSCFENSVDKGKLADESFVRGLCNASNILDLDPLNSACMPPLLCNVYNVEVVDTTGLTILQSLLSLSDSDEDEFVDASEHQLEDRELTVSLPHTSTDMMHRRTDSMESYPDMSSESESEMSPNEARVYTTKTSPKRVSASHRRTASQDKIRSLGKSASLDSTSQHLQQQQQQQQQHGGSNSSLSNIGGGGGPTRQGGRKRRKKISEKPNISLNLWSFMKNAIGKELSKIPMPVNFNEPLSMLQRIMEEMEYGEILDQAARCQDSAEQMAWVAAFTVSAYATTLFRVGKPFNPLLGETFEFDRTEDLGWRGISEQ
ncbi:oxysterol-binding protein, partial [Elysia marginata]